MIGFFIDWSKMIINAKQIELLDKKVIIVSYYFPWITLCYLEQIFIQCSYGYIFSEIKYL